MILTSPPTYMLGACPRPGRATPKEHEMTTHTTTTRFTEGAVR